jgi:hypothetical protein
MPVIYQSFGITDQCSHFVGLSLSDVSLFLNDKTDRRGPQVKFALFEINWRSVNSRTFCADSIRALFISLE